MKISTTTTLEWIYAIFIALFAYTGLSKFAHVHGFELVLVRSPLLHGVAGFLAWTVPSVELVIVLLLLIPSTQLYGLVSAFIMLLLFTAYLLYMLLFIPDLPCSCGGIISALSWPQHLVLNTFLIVLAWLGFWLRLISKHSKLTTITR